jgi:hypothetical protein
MCILSPEARSFTLQIDAGPGWMFPYGDWSRDFSRGRLFEVRVYAPFVQDVMIGGGIAAVTLPGESGNAELEFLLPQLLLEYELHYLKQWERIAPHLGFRAGLSREVLKVGSGRESDFDVFIGAGAGCSWQLNSRASLRIDAVHQWFLAPRGGRGFILTPIFSFRL